MNKLILTLIFCVLLPANLLADTEENNVFNQQALLNSCENLTVLAPLVSDILKVSLDEGLSPETILQHARNAKCENVLKLVEDIQAYTPEAGRLTIPTERYEISTYEGK